jgi:hypothetical protein
VTDVELLRIRGSSAEFNINTGRFLVSLRVGCSATERVLSALKGCPDSPCSSCLKSYVPLPESPRFDLPDGF